MKHVHLLSTAFVTLLILTGAGCFNNTTEPVDPNNSNQNGEPVTVTNFEECVAAGNPIMESYPRKCQHEDETFTENIGNAQEKSDLIRLTTPQPNQEVSSPLTVSGEARGTWFFEATFPVILTDWDGLIIAEGYAEAQDEWMTEEFVPFEATLTFSNPELYNRGSLILQKSNPSGLPENDDALEIPIVFAETETSAK